MNFPTHGACERRWGELCANVWPMLAVRFPVLTLLARIFRSSVVGGTSTVSCHRFVLWSYWWSKTSDDCVTVRTPAEDSCESVTISDTMPIRVVVLPVSLVFGE